MTDKQEQEQVGWGEYIVIAATLLTTGLVGYMSHKYEQEKTSEEYTTMNQKEFIEVLNNPSVDKPTTVIKSQRIFHLSNQYKENERSL